MMPTSQPLSYFSFPICVVLVIFALESSNGNLLDLPVGFNRSVRDALDSYSAVIKAHSAIDGQSFFLPFLSSSSFNGNNSSDHEINLGFAVGFLFYNGSNPLTIDRQQLDDGIYLSVCAGMAGNHSTLLKEKLPVLHGIRDAGLNASLDIIADGFVVPVWIAKGNGPLRSLNAFLNIVAVQVSSNITRKDLQLQDYDGKAVWIVNNAGMMEMQDSGNLVVYDSKNKTYVMWQSNSEPTNILVQGQKLMVGEKLTSTNGDYSAQMEKGGLMLVLNDVQLVDGQSSPYWVFPIHFRNDTYSSDGSVIFVDSLNNGPSVNTLIASSPCASSNVDDQAFGMLGNSSLRFYLEAGLCSKDPSFRGTQRAFIATGRDDDFPISWNFLTLENDGKLYINAVIKNSSAVLAGMYAALRYAFDHEEAVFTVEGLARNRSIATQEASPFNWGKCDVPVACGPLGMCTPQGSRLCSCPLRYFSPIDPKDSSQGCQPLISLPTCTSGIYTGAQPPMFEFEEIQASSIFLLGDWAYASHIHGRSL